MACVSLALAATSSAALSKDATLKSYAYTAGLAPLKWRCRTIPLRRSAKTGLVTTVCSLGEDRANTSGTDSVRNPSESPLLAQAVAFAAVGALMFGSLTVGTPAADAAQGGGRVGGSAGFARTRSAPPPQRSAPAPSNLYVAPSVTVAPVYGGFFAPPPFFGGFGWSPFGYATGVTIVTEGPSFFGFFFSAALFLIVASVVVNVIFSIFRRD